MTATTTTPLWRQAFDAVERRVAAGAEAMVATDRFADVAASATRATGPVARLVPAPRTPSPHQTVAWVGGQIDRSMHRTRNVLKVVTGFDEPELATTPKEVVWERDRARLYRYRSAQRCRPVPLLLTMSLVSTPKVFDLRPNTSVIAYLLQAGFDVYLLDWGIADERDAGNRLDTYIDFYLPGAVDAITGLTGVEQIDVLGYCFGGVLALLFAASQPDRVRRLAVMATPVDWSHMGPLVAMTQHGRLEPEELFDRTGNVPASAIRNGFTMLQPTATVAGYASLLQHLDNDAFVEQFRVVGAWVDDHVPFPGACFADLTRALARDNTLITGTTPVGDRLVDLADITSPTLCIVGEKDHICPPAAAEPVVDLIGSEHSRLLRIPAGHVGLVMSRTASKVALPALIDWFTSELGEPS